MPADQPHLTDDESAAIAAALPHDTVAALATAFVAGEIETLSAAIADGAATADVLIGVDTPSYLLSTLEQWPTEYDGLDMLARRCHTDLPGDVVYDALTAHWTRLDNATGSQTVEMAAARRRDVIKAVSVLFDVGRNRAANLLDHADGDGRARIDQLVDAFTTPYDHNPVGFHRQTAAILDGLQSAPVSANGVDTIVWTDPDLPISFEGHVWPQLIRVGTAAARHSIVFRGPDLFAPNPLTVAKRMAAYIDQLLSHDPAVWTETDAYGYISPIAYVQLKRANVSPMDHTILLEGLQTNDPVVVLDAVRRHTRNGMFSNYHFTAEIWRR